MFCLYVHMNMAINILPRLKGKAYIATTTTHPVFMAPFTPVQLKNEIKKLLLTNHQAPLASLNECYKTVALISKLLFSFS